MNSVKIELSSTRRKKLIIPTQIKILTTWPKGIYTSKRCRYLKIDKNYFITIFMYKIFTNVKISYLGKILNWSYFICIHVEVSYNTRCYKNIDKNK